MKKDMNKLKKDLSKLDDEVDMVVGLNRDSLFVRIPKHFEKTMKIKKHDKLKMTMYKYNDKLKIKIEK